MSCGQSLPHFIGYDLVLTPKTNFSNIDLSQGTLPRRSVPIHLVEACILSGESVRVIAFIERGRHFRKSGAGPRPDLDSPAPERARNIDSGFAGPTDQSAARDIAAFRWNEFRYNTIAPARKVLKTARRERLRALAQVYTNSNIMLSVANGIYESTNRDFGCSTV